MERKKPRSEPSLSQAIVAFVLLAASFLIVSQKISEPSAAIQPIFQRPNVQVDTGPGWSSAMILGKPVLACDANGILHAAWSDARIGEAGIFHARSLDNGKTWIDEARIDNAPGFDNVAPSMAIDTASALYMGNIYVTWQRVAGASMDILVTTSMDGGANWSNPVQLDTSPFSMNSTSPHVGIDIGGAVFVAFQDSMLGNEDIYSVSSIDGGVTWGTEVQVSISTAPDVDPVVTARGIYMLVAWESWSATDRFLLLAYSTDDGSTWFRRTISSLTLNRGAFDSLSITMDESFYLHAAWVRTYSTGLKAVIYARSRDIGWTWSYRSVVDDAPDSLSYSPSSVSVAFYSGLPYVIWTDNRNGDRDTFASWSEDAGVTWGDGTLNSNDVRVDDTDENAASLDDESDQRDSFALASSYGLFVIWSDNRNTPDYHAYFSVFQNAEMVITEVQDNPDGSEQIEICNQGWRIISLAGWTLDIQGVPIDLTPLGDIAPGIHVVIGDPLGVNLTVNIDLGDEGGYVRLLDSTGAEKDSVRYGQLGRAPDPLDSESVSRVMIGSKYSEWWTRSPIPTFAAVNTVAKPITSPDFVLNEVLFDSVNPGNRFVEIYLTGGGTVDLSGSMLVGDSVYVLPPATLTNMSPYNVVKPADAPALFTILDSNGDNLYLYSPGGALMDMVGWNSTHTQDTSMARIQDGNGTADGFDDTSSIMAGWRFGQTPSKPDVLVVPSQSNGGGLGSQVTYNITIVNNGMSGDFFNVEAIPGPLGWAASIFQADMVTPLIDSAGDPDLIPDTGLLAPASSYSIHVKVDIPAIPPSSDSEVTRIKATASSDSFVNSEGLLTTLVHPYEYPTSAASPPTIWVNSSGPAYVPKEATVTIGVTGRGFALTKPKPQDVVLLIDSSGSMTTNDPTNLRLAAAKYYVDLLAVPDRAAVVDFDSIATLVNNDHLSIDYTLVKQNIDLINSAGGTDLAVALVAGTDELIGYGDPNHKWVEIMLTDGQGGVVSTILSEAQRAADNGIVVFTIGLGSTADEGLLQDIAEITGGVYLKAENASQLTSIYYTISRLVYDIAGFDQNVLDNAPMVNVTLPTNIEYVAGSALPAPDYIGAVAGNTNLQWNVSELKIGETWTASFSVTSNIAGLGLQALTYPDSKVSYVDYQNVTVGIPFPEVLIDVLAPPPPIPDLTLSPSDIDSWPPQPFTVNDVVQFNATIWNLGTGPSIATVARFHDGLPPSPQIGSDQSLAPIANGSSQIVSVTWTASSSGGHQICVVADPGDIVAESNETNNTACVMINVRPLPETRPEYVPVSALPLGTIRIGLSLPVSLSVIVSNIGNATAANDTVLAFREQSSLPFAEQTVTPLAIGASSSRFSAVWTASSSPGTHYIVADVDYYGDITEWDETNNAFVWTVEVVAGPITTLVIGAPNYTSGMTFVKSTTQLSFSVSDQSTTGILNTTYRTDGGTWRNYSVTGPFVLTGEGDHLLEWYSVDFAGNQETIKTRVLRVDDTPPSLSIVPDAAEVAFDTQFAIAANDGTGSGVALTRYRTNGGTWVTYAASFSLAPDSYVIEYTSTDNLGNSGSQTRNVVVLAQPPVNPGLETNYKPIVALVFAIILVIVGIWAANRRPWDEQKDRRSIIQAFALLSFPFVVAEMVTGIVSFFTSLLSIPPLFGLGLFVDAGILVAGIAVCLHWVMKDPRLKKEEEKKLALGDSQNPEPPP